MCTTDEDTSVKNSVSEGEEHTSCPVFGYISPVNIEYISRIRGKCRFCPCESLKRSQMHTDQLRVETYLAPRQFAYLPKLMKSVSVRSAEIRGTSSSWFSSRDWAKRIWRDGEKRNPAGLSYSEIIWCRLLHLAISYPEENRNNTHNVPPSRPLFGRVISESAVSLRCSDSIWSNDIDSSFE